MKRSYKVSKNPLRIIAVFLLVPAILLLIFTQSHWRHIESDLKERANDALRNNKQCWAKVETRNRGRHLLLVGSPPNEESIQLATKIAKNIHGGKSVKFLALEAKKKPSAVLYFSMKDGQLQVSGEINNKEQLQSVIKTIKDKNLKKIHTDNITLRNAQDLSFDHTILDVLPYLLEGQTLAVTSKRIFLSGTAQYHDNYLTLNTMLKQQFSHKMIDESIIQFPETFELKLCQFNVNESKPETDITFKANSTKLSKNSTDTLNAIAQTLHKCPSLFVKITGHTDSSGNPKNNVKLSKNRANAVKDFFVSKQLAPNRFTTIGKGFLDPKYPDDNLTLQALNRRIEIELSENPFQPTQEN